MIAVKRALSDTTFSKIKLPSSIFFHKAVADTIAGSLVNFVSRLRIYRNTKKIKYNSVLLHFSYLPATFR